MKRHIEVPNSTSGPRDELYKVTWLVSLMERSCLKYHILKDCQFSLSHSLPLLIGLATAY